jgi:hypothetical protein
MEILNAPRMPSAIQSAKDVLMYPLDDQIFEARLPQLEQPVRIDGLRDAQIFVRRWIIRDRDPALKALLRSLERARSAEAGTIAMGCLKGALRSRGLLSERQS